MNTSSTKLLDILKEQLEIQTSQVCKVTEEYLSENISFQEYNKHLVGLEKELIVLLEQDQNKSIEWFKVNIISKINAFTQKLSSEIKKLSASTASLIVKGIRALLGLISKFKNKYPKLFKFTVALAVIIFVVLFFGVVNAFGQDPQGLGYNPEQLDTMVGLLNMITDQALDAGIRVGDIIEAKAYLQDLKDGVLDLQNYSQAAKDIASSAEEVYRGLSQEASSGEGQVMEKALSTLKAALESGKDTIVKVMGRAIDSTGKPTFN